jgi:arylsulfatase A-like enzyme
MQIHTRAYLLLLTFLTITCSALVQAKPNIVMIMTDNLGYGDVGIYGGMRAPTPRIDQLAREGIQFRDFQVEPGCSPSRAAILTGRMAVRSGTDAVLELGVEGGLHPHEITLAEILGAAGYKSAHYGKWHLGFSHERQPQSQGFDDFWGILFTSAPGDPADADFQAIGIPTQKVLAAKKGEKARVVGELTNQYRGLIDAEITDKAVKYIRDNAGGEQPFFLYLPFINPHNPVVPHPDFKGKSGGGAYSDALMEIDYNTGRILDAIAAENIAEDTIVIWLSDNGPQRLTLEPYHSGDPGPWSGELGSVFEGGLRTVGMISWPGTIEPFVSDEIFHSMDFFASLAQLTGAELPADRPIDSIDQSAYLLNGELGSKRDHVMVYFNGEYAAMRYRQFKVMRAIYSRKASSMSQPSYLKSIPRIYNLRADPKEEYIISGGMEGVTRSLVIKESQLRLKYEMSFKEFPNGDYSFLK